MNSKSLIIIFSIFLSIILSIYILSKEDNFLPSNNIRSDVIKPKIQVANRGEPRSTLKSGYVQIGRLQAMIPLGWKREKPSNSMRIAQFTMGMGGETEELKDYALMAAIILTDSEPYYFKGTGPKITIDNNLNNFEMFIKSIENL